MGAKHPDLFGRYVWLVDTIRSHGRITFKEINECWKRSGLSYGEDLPWRTFMNHKRAITDVFGIYIECDARDGHRYYIDHPEQLAGDAFRSWLIDSYATLNQLKADRRLAGRICFEEMPSGNRFLTRILEAMRLGVVLRVTHQGFGKPEAKTFEVEPYAVKVYKRRWYLVGHTPALDQVRIYAIDRMHEVEETEDHFQMPESFDLNAFFDGCVGVIVDKTIPVEHVVIRVYAPACHYLETLPIHSSQRVVAREGDTVTFALDVRPTFELKQELLMEGDELEIVEPQSLRDEMREMAARLLNRYSHE